MNLIKRIIAFFKKPQVIIKTNSSEDFYPHSSFREECDNKTIRELCNDQQFSLLSKKYDVRYLEGIHLQMQERF